MTAMDKIETRLFINGEFAESKSGKTFNLTNPSTEEKFVSVYEAGEEDVDLAVDAAERAFPAWRDLDSFSKGDCFLKLAELVNRDREELKYLDAVSMGQSTGTSDGDVNGTIASLKYTAGLAHTMHGQTSLHSPGFLNITLRQPYGVCAAIIPWNVPLLMFTAKFCPCLAAGNTLVLNLRKRHR